MEQEAAAAAVDPQIVTLLVALTGVVGTLLAGYITNRQRAMGELALQETKAQNERDAFEQQSKYELRQKDADFRREKKEILYKLLTELRKNISIGIPIESYGSNYVQKLGNLHKAQRDLIDKMLLIGDLHIAEVSSDINKLSEEWKEYHRLEWLIHDHQFDEATNIVYDYEEICAERTQCEQDILKMIKATQIKLGIIDIEQRSVIIS